MSISFVGQATGTTSATLPTHQAGDLIIGLAFRDGSNSLPGLPAGWTDVVSGAGNSASARVGAIVAVGAGTSSGTWSNATSVLFLVYRSDAGTVEIGAAAEGNGTGTSVTYPGLTLEDADGSSWVAALGCHRSSNTALETPPDGTVNRATASDATDEVAGHDTDGGVTSWAGGSVSVGGTSNGWRCFSVEIKEVTSGGSYTLVADSAAVEVSGTPADLPASRRLSAAAADIAATAANAALKHDRRLAAGAGSVSVTASSAGLCVVRRLVVQPAAVTIACPDADLAYQAATRGLNAEPASITVTAHDATLTVTAAPQQGIPDRGSGGGHARRRKFWEDVFRELDEAEAAAAAQAEAIELPAPLPMAEPAVAAPPRTEPTMADVIGRIEGRLDAKIATLAARQAIRDAMMDDDEAVALLLLAS